MPAQIYKPDRVKGPFDAVVIGTGIGGLAAAALLAKAGKRVLALERHYVAGGFTHTFARKGYEWDVGLHYVGEVGRRDSILRRLFDQLSDSQLEWAPMPPVYDRMCFPDAVYEYEAPKARLRERLEGYFPRERQAIADYFRLIDEVNAAVKNFFMAKAMPGLLAGALGPWLSRKFLHWSDLTTYEVLSGLTSDPRLIGVLTAQYGNYGLPPRQSSFAVHAIVTKHYFDGGYYPVGGAGRIAETIAPMIESAGGQVLVKAEVQEILLNHGKAIGVRLSDGNDVLAPCVVSDAGVYNTFLRLLPENYPAVEKIRERLQQLHRSGGHLCLYVGMRHAAAELAISPSNYWIYPGYDHDATMTASLHDPEAPMPATYISFPSFKDPVWESRHPGRSTLEAITFVPYDWFRKWQGTTWQKRGADYEAFKEKFARRLLEQVYRRIPQLQGKVDYYELSTPLSTQHFANYSEGEIYGLDHNPRRFREKWLRPATPVPNLFLTGQDIVTDGIGGALMGAVLAASVVLRHNVLTEVASGTYSKERRGTSGRWKNLGV